MIPTGGKGFANKVILTSKHMKKRFVIIAVIYIIGYVCSYFMIRQTMKSFCNGKWTTSDRGITLLLSTGSWMTVIGTGGAFAMLYIETLPDEPANW